MVCSYQIFRRHHEALETTVSPDLSKTSFLTILVTLPLLFSNQDLLDKLYGKVGRAAQHVAL